MLKKQNNTAPIPVFPAQEKRGKLKFMFRGNAIEQQMAQIAVVEKEAARQEMAYELHDSVNPLLCAAKIYIGLLNPSSDAEVFAKKEAMEIVSAAIENVKQVADANSIFDRADTSLLQLITQHISKIAKLQLFRINFSCNDNQALEKLSSGYKLVLFRVIQEHLNNIIKYSKASSVCVKIRLCKTKSTLQIEDNGVGFDNNTVKKGIGLCSMAKRVQKIGGALHFLGTKGCRLHVSIPNNSNAQQSLPKTSLFLTRF